MHDHQREPDDKRRAAIGAVAGRGDRAAMQLRQLLHDAETEPEPAMLAREARVGLPEMFEDVREKLRRYTAARVADRDLDVRVHARQLQLDLAAASGELDRVRQQIPHDLQQSIWIAGYRRRQ